MPVQFLSGRLIDTDDILRLVIAECRIVMRQYIILHLFLELIQ